MPPAAATPRGGLEDACRAFSPTGRGGLGPGLFQAAAAGRALGRSAELTADRHCATHQARGRAAVPERVVGLAQPVLERATARLEQALRPRAGADHHGWVLERRHQTFLKTPTTRPRTCTSRLRIGSI